MFVASALLLLSSNGPLKKNKKCAKGDGDVIFAEDFEAHAGFDKYCLRRHMLEWTSANAHPDQLPGCLPLTCAESYGEQIGP